MRGRPRPDNDTWIAAAGTMFAALYGELVPHAWRDPESEHDAYSLFYHRSLAMGWLDDRGAGGGLDRSYGVCDSGTRC